MQATDHPEKIDDFEVLGVLGRGGMGWVYRVHDPSRDEVALKWLQVAAGASNLDRLRFEREFKMAAAFEHPGLVPVYQFGEHRNAPYYTMEYVAGVNIRDYLREVKEKASHKTFLKKLATVCFQLFEALEYIHSLDIVHRDLKPENILIDGSGRPRLLDFGLARRQDRTVAEEELSSEEHISRLTEPGMVIGTVHYMAPEQVVGGELDRRTDLYALGVILYELLVGKLPYTGPDPITVLGQILHAPEATFPDNCGPYPSQLEDLVMQLMNREMDQRLPDCAALKVRWLEIFKTLDADTTVELEFTPQSLPVGQTVQLLAPKFVGRQKILQGLASQFSRTVQGRPGLVTLCGPCGVGKTRLLQEAAGRARSQGLSVLRSASLEMETLPYQIWVEFLSWAARHGLPEGLEVFRDALAVLLPELGRPDADTDWDDPMRKFHLFEGMSRLLEAAAARKPLVLLLEDLQWADPSSLEFLHYLGRRFAKADDQAARILLILSFRDDELREKGGLISTLQSLSRVLTPTEFRVETLSLEETAEMVHSMLARGALEAESLKRLYEETEGNPLFISEIVKTFLTEGRLHLEDESWQLDTGALMTTSSGGSRVPVTVRDAVRRRLEGLSLQDLDILRVAAAIGYSFSFDLLATATEVPELELLERIMQMAGRRILADDQDSRNFRFHNHPIVEVVSKTTPPDQRRQIHLAVAQALDSDDTPRASAFELAHHYKLGGDPLSAVRHLLESARVASRTFAYERSRELYVAAGNFPESGQLISDEELVERTAHSAHCAGLTEDALEKFTWLLDRELEPLDRARVLRKVGVCWDTLGDVEQAHRCLLEALAVLKFKPASASRLGVFKFIRRALVWAANKNYKKDPARSRELHAICEPLNRILFFLRPKGWLLDSIDIAVLQQVVAGAVASGDVKAQAELYAGYMWLRAPDKMRKAAYNRLRNSVRLARTLEDRPFKANTIRDAGYLLHLAGYPETGYKVCREGKELSEKLGDVHGLALNHILMLSILLHLGRIEEAAEHGRRAIDMAEAVGNKRDLALAYIDLAQAESLLGQTVEAEKHLALVQKIQGAQNIPFLHQLVYSVRGWVAWAKGDYGVMLDCAEEGQKIARQIAELPFYKLRFLLMRETAKVALGVPNRVNLLLEKTREYEHLNLGARRLALVAAEDTNTDEIKELLADARRLENLWEITEIEKMLRGST